MIKKEKQKLNNPNEMIHVTKHYDATDIDKFSSNVLGKSNIVYHPKKRFPSTLQNMHYN